MWSNEFVWPSEESKLMYINRCKTVLDLKKKIILRQKSFKIARHFTSNRCIYIELDRPNGLDKYIHSGFGQPY